MTTQDEDAPRFVNEYMIDDDVVLDPNQASDDEDESTTDESIVDETEDVHDNDPAFYESIPEDRFSLAIQARKKLQEVHTRKRILNYYNDQCRRFRKHKIHPDHILNVLCTRYSKQYANMGRELFDTYMSQLTSSISQSRVLQLPEPVLQPMVVLFMQ